jgi:hypothetical protein
LKGKKRKRKRKNLISLHFFLSGYLFVHYICIYIYSTDKKAGSAGLNVGLSIDHPGVEPSFKDDASASALRPMVLTAHVVQNTDIRYMVKMGGGMPPAYFKKIREMHRKNPLNAASLELPEVPKPRSVNYIQLLHSIGMCF